MDKILSAKFKMMKAVAELYTTYQARFDVVPAMAPTMTVFLNTNDTIEDLIPKADQDTNAMTNQRDELREALYASTVFVTTPVAAYADKIGDLVLEGEMDWTIPKLRKLTIDVLGPQCTSIHTKATSLLTVATPSGLTQAKLDKMEADNEAWMDKESATRNLQSEISEYGRLLRKAIRSNMNLLEKQLDKLVYNLSETDAELYGFWVDAREVEAPHRTQTQVKVTVTDMVNETPIYAADLELVNGTTYKAVTNVGGEAMFQKKLKPGLYFFKVMKPGFKDFEIIEYRVFKGKINRIDVKLETAVVE